MDTSGPQDPFAVVLGALNRYDVRYIVIAGQACLYYGAIQNTKDGDLWAFPSEENLNRLAQALQKIGAVRKFLPGLSLHYLSKGHAVHYVLPGPAGGFRVDGMIAPSDLEVLHEALETEAAALKAAVRAYWGPRLKELKELFHRDLED